MSDAMIVRHCAPTLASMKAGSLFNCAFATLEEMYASLRQLNRRLQRKGLRALSLRFRDGIGLIYLYRPALLRAALRDEQAAALLAECGYDGADADRLVKRLQDRLAQEAEFPHEIGLFLDYPPSDVEGFMHRRNEARCSGVWKVYGDVEEAQTAFARLRQCTRSSLARLARGCAMEQLVV